MNKFCPRCRKNLETTKFKISSRTKDGFQTRCEDCTEKYRLTQKERYANPDYRQKVLTKNKEKYQSDPIFKEKLNKQRVRNQIKQYQNDPIYKEKEKDRNRTRQTKRYHSDPIYREKVLKQRREELRELYYTDLKYREKVIKQRTKDQIKQYHSDPKFKVNSTISTAIRESLKNGKEGKSWESVVVYTVEELMTHLESLFQEGMTWENYGEWHIDHRIPKSWFNFATINDPEFIKCWDLRNLKPMWASENIAKGNKFSD